MATKINQPATGLQSLLGTQSFGDNPNLMDQLAIPIVDLLPFLGQQQLRSQRAAQTAVVVGNGATLTVPPGEAWIPVHGSAKVLMNVLDGGAAVNYSISMRVRNSTFAGGAFCQVAHREGILQEIVPGQTLSMGCEWNPPQQTVFGPGSLFLCAIDSKSTVNTTDTDVILIYYELAI